MANPEKLTPHEPVQIGPLDRVRLGGDEAAICAAFDLTPTYEGEEPSPRMILMDVGFRKDGNGQFGPYDLDGSGEKRTFSSSYVMMTQRKDRDGNAVSYFAEVPVGKQIELGRESAIAQQLGYSEDMTVSRRHAKLTIDGEWGNITLEDQGSLNGTGKPLSLERVLHADRKSDFGYTVNIRENVSQAGKGRFYQPPETERGWGNGVYGDRPIIARDTPINGGVYPVGHRDGEALVIDDVKYPAAYEKLYGKLEEVLRTGDIAKFSLGALKRRIGTEYSNQETRVVKATLDLVMDTLRYSIPETDALASRGQKIELSMYIQKGVGVCRTQAALSAYLVERLIKSGKLDGRVSIDRNMSQTIKGERGGHAWARYTSASGQVYIIDPAQRFAGTLADAQNNPRSWDYRRTEDLTRELMAA